jgi:DNA-binding NarL/FixJ family response regulator
MLTPESKILIADDHALMRQAIRDLVSSIFPKENILETESSNGLLELINAEPLLKLILLDLYMPGEDIFSIIKLLKKKNPGLLIVVISASENHDHIEKALELGVDGYILKSYSMQIIKQALELVMAGGRYIPPKMYELEQSNLSTIKSTEIDNHTLGQVESLLTERQREIFKLLGEGKSNKEIASTFYISVNTVKIHVSAILKTLNLENRSQAGIISQNIFEDTQ